MIVNAFTCTGASAVLIMSGLKRVENRSCLPVPARGRCAMSVSKKFCRKEYDGVKSWLTRFSATCGGQTAFPSLAATQPPAWLYRNNWKLMRIVRRGAATPSEWVRCKVGYNSFSIRLR